MKLKHSLLFIIGSLGLVFQGSGALAEGDTKWIIHARGIAVAPSVTSTLPLSVNTKLAPELDFTRMLDQNFGVELILATSKHTVKNGSATAGTVSVLPPTLTLVYRMDSMSGFRPYLGAGLNYTLFYNVNLPGLDVGRRSLGMAAQVGCDYAVNDRWLVNFDLKKINVQTNLKDPNGVKLDTLQINPWVWGLGVGYRI